ncbi:TIGR04282 family arsenosugar biosynthesis glycosyltransferase [Bacteroidota bacterium]
MTNSQYTSLLIIFVRNPEAGKVKTRLAMEVGNIRALEIYNELLTRTWMVTRDIEVKKTVYYTEALVVNDLWDEGGFQKAQQRGNDIGERMSEALNESFKLGYKKICLIGSDIYNLESIILLTAFEQLDNKDVVLGPAEDGGYYLIGMKNFEPTLFTGKKWSSSTVFHDTLEDINKGGLSVALLPELIDIDTAEDLNKVRDLI